MQSRNIATFGELVGQSQAMLVLYEHLANVSASDLSVLIFGETGTGKELVAEGLHKGSARASGPFVVFDCSAAAPTLIESEFFGHERGAFTGAVSARAGVFEQAHGGTLFLDELGELPKELQPKLLRVLEKRQIRRLGSSRTTPIDIRLVAATNRDLRREVQRGAFREDLYFRVAGARIEVPPLRQRLDDLPLLVARFLAEAQANLSVDAIPERTWQSFREYHWPGNVRELRNAVLRVLVHPEGLLERAESSDDDAPHSTIVLRALGEARREAVSHFERDYLRALLARAQGSVTVAAAIAQVSRQAIHKLIAKHGLPRSH